MTREIARRTKTNANANERAIARARGGRARARTRVARARARDDDETSNVNAIASERFATWRTKAKTFRVRELKEFAKNMAVSVAGCAEKGEIEDRVARGWCEREQRATFVPLRQLGNVMGNPRAGYAVCALDVGGDVGLCDFVIDTGATKALISPRALAMMEKENVIEGAAIRGLTGTGETLRQKVTLKGVRMGAHEFVDGLEAAVTDLTVVGLPPVIGGLLGLEFLSKFVVEFDFARSALSFWPLGSVEAGAVDVASLVKIPLKTHPVGLRTARVSLNSSAPFDAVVDMGSFFSVANWIASASAGIGPESDKVKRGGLQVSGVDGRSMNMAMAPFELRVLGEPGGENLASAYRGLCCVGDLPAFNALGASVTPFMAMGLDVIGRGRAVFDASQNLLYLAKGDETY